MAFKDEDIESVIEEARRLPATHRHGFRGSRDDVAEGTDGRLKILPTPETPEEPLGS
jgi:hypothetical protein